MTLSAADRETLQAAARIKRSLARERRRNTLAARPHEKKHRGRQRDNGHLAFIRRLPCVATYLATGRFAYGCQAAHVRLTNHAFGKPMPGAQVKPDDCWTLPLSPEQHRIQSDVRNERPFWADHGLTEEDVLTLCRDLYAASGDADVAEAIIRNHRHKGERA
ncbi:hypothetical protein ACFPIF_10385 [Brevundimonas faecalis]|uniref:hypothetical protein n=1 Tax=Brevundimonas faecalis TaxID=947378 RepID=UPI00360B1389